jgi:hypothetical protein
MGAQVSSAASVQGDTSWAGVNALTALSPEFSAANAAVLEDDSHAASLVVARHALHAEVAALAKKHPALQASLAKVSSTCTSLRSQYSCLHASKYFTNKSYHVYYTHVLFCVIFRG